jgi:hypothetical protein
VPTSGEARPSVIGLQYGDKWAVAVHYLRKLVLVVAVSNSMSVAFQTLLITSILMVLLMEVRDRAPACRARRMRVADQTARRRARASTDHRPTTQSVLREQYYQTDRVLAVLLDFMLLWGYVCTTLTAANVGSTRNDLLRAAEAAAFAGVTIGLVGILWQRTAKLRLSIDLRIR